MREQLSDGLRALARLALAPGLAAAILLLARPTASLLKHLATATVRDPMGALILSACVALVLALAANLLHVEKPAEGAKTPAAGKAA